jgi:hypothetical protein
VHLVGFYSVLRWHCSGLVATWSWVMPVLEWSVTVRQLLLVATVLYIWYTTKVSSLCTVLTRTILVHAVGVIYIGECSEFGTISTVFSSNWDSKRHTINTVTQDTFVDPYIPKVYLFHFYPGLRFFCCHICRNILLLPCMLHDLPSLTIWQTI